MRLDEIVQNSLRFRAVGGAIVMIGFVAVVLVLRAGAPELVDVSTEKVRVVEIVEPKSDQQTARYIVVEVEGGEERTLRLPDTSRLPTPGQRLEARVQRFDDGTRKYQLLGP